MKAIDTSRIQDWQWLALETSTRALKHTIGDMVARDWPKAHKKLAKAFISADFCGLHEWALRAITLLRGESLPVYNNQFVTVARRPMMIDKILGRLILQRCGYP